LPASVSFDELRETVRLVRELTATVAKHEAILEQLLDRVTSLERRLDPPGKPARG
jgi:hypothetical protein